MPSISAIHGLCGANINNISHDKKSNNEFSNQLNKVSSSGTESILPKNSIKNKIDISGDANELHANNHQQQIKNITQMLISSDSHITHDMVEKVLNLGGQGCTLQQEINHRPESALVVLTLFEPQEIPRELLSAAVKLVKSISEKDLNKEKNIKNILKDQQENVDKHLAKFLSTRGSNILQNLVTGYQEKYVSPAIKEKIKPYCDDVEIKNRSANEFLVSELNEILDSDVSKLIMEYNKIDDNQYGDKYQQLNNIFRSLEKKIGIIRPLTVKMDLTEPAKQKIPENEPSSDKVDGLVSQLKTNLPSNISNSYNTTTINNYASSPLNANIEHVSYQKQDNKVDQESSSPNTHENDKLLDDQMLSSPKGFQLPEAVSHKLVVEPTNENPATVFNTLFNPKKSTQKTRVNADPVKSEVLAGSRNPSGEKQVRIESKQPDNFAPSRPKAEFTANRYQKDANNHWVLKTPDNQKAVTLSAGGLLNHNQSGKEIYRGEREAPKAVVDTGSHLQNIGKSVTLTAQGALTKHQSQKDIYQEKTPTVSAEIDNMPKSTNNFASQYISSATLQDNADNTKKTWQIGDKKGSRPVITTELGAITRNVAGKQQYTDSDTQLTKG